MQTEIQTTITKVEDTDPTQEELQNETKVEDTDTTQEELQEDDDEIYNMVKQIVWIKQNTFYSTQMKIIKNFKDLYNETLYPTVMSKICKAYANGPRKTIKIVNESLNKKKIHLLIKFANTIYNNRNMDEKEFLSYKFKEFETEMQQRFDNAIDQMKRECNL